MCIYTQFQYLCLHGKTKIQTPCDNVVTDSHGTLTCLNDTHDNQRTFGHRTYGVGICSNIHCAWNLSVLPLGDYGDNKKFGNSSSFEDDTEIDDSLEAREERVARWYRLLSTDQQLDHLQTEYPVPINELSIAGRDLQNFPYGAAVVPTLDTIRWQELNPLYLTPAMLQWLIFNRVLPASIVDDHKSMKISPLKPTLGPFKPMKPHKCPKKYGICKVCGENIGNPKKKEKVLSYRQNTAMAGLMTDALKQADPIGTVLDPFVGLKWDDKKGEYRKFPLANDLQLYDPSQTVASNLALGLPTTQTVDASAVFSGQGELLTDSNALASMELDAINASLGIDPNASYAAQNWYNLEFNSDPSTLPQVEFPADFSFEPQTSFGANLDASINTGTQAELNLGLSGRHPDAFMPMQASDAGAVMNLQSGHDTQVANDTRMLDPASDEVIFRDNTADFSFADPAVPAPQTFESTGDLMMMGNASGDDFGFEDFFNKHPEWQVTDQPNGGYSAHTLNLVRQMVHTTMNGGVSRLSYDPEANALYEQVIQRKIAGLE